MLQLLKNTKISVWGLCFVMVGVVFLTASNGFSDDKAMKMKEIKEIKQPAALDTPTFQREIPREAHYFVKGTLDAKGDNWITINDHQFIIAPDASIGCGVGDFVGIQVNDEKKVISCESVKK